MRTLRIGWACAAFVACWPSLAESTPPPNRESPSLALSPGECKDFGRLHRRLPRDANSRQRSAHVLVERADGVLLVRLTRTEASSDGMTTQSVETIQLRTCEEAIEWTAFTLGLLLEPEDNLDLPRPDDPRPQRVARPSTAAAPPRDGEAWAGGSIATDSLVLGIGGGFDGSAPSGSGATTTALIGFRLGHVRPTAFADWWAPGRTTTTLPSQGPVHWQQWAVGAALCADEPTWRAARTRLGLCVGARFNGLELESEAAANGGTGDARWVTADVSLLASYEIVPGMELELSPWLRVSPKPPTIDAGPGQLLEQPRAFEGRVQLAVVWQAWRGSASAGDQP